jgi:hypothetical protein
MRRLAGLKRDFGFLDAAAFAKATAVIDASEAAVAAAEPGKSAGAASAKPMPHAEGAASAARFQTNDLFWPVGKSRFASLFSLAGVAADLALTEARLLTTKRLPLYFGRSRRS